MSATIHAIDDDEVILKVLADVLLSYDENYNIKTFLDPLEYIDAVDPEDPPDVIVSDIMMPKLDGIKMLQLLKEKGINRPFIVISGMATKVHALNALNLGAYGMLEKPFEEASLVNCIKEGITYTKGFLLTKKLIKMQEEIIASAERLHTNYEKRLIQAENELINITGIVVPKRENIKEYFKDIKVDRELNLLLMKLNKDLKNVKVEFNKIYSMGEDSSMVMDKVIG